MFGFILAFITALSEASKDITSKQSLRHIDEYTASFAMHVVISVLLAPVVVYLGVQPVSVEFMLALLTSSVLQLAVILLYMKAIKRSELSVTVPLVTLTPLFMLLTSPILIGEFPGAWGLAGIFLIVAGTYILNLKSGKGGLWAPFASVVTDKGPRYMLIVAFLWSITANIDKIGVEETSPVLWAFSKDLIIMLYLIPIMFLKSEKPMAQLKSMARPLFLIGLFRTVSVLSQMYAIKYILVAYVISIKRSSALLIIIFAYFFLNEKMYFKTRLIGILVITMGLVLIAVS